MRIGGGNGFLLQNNVVSCVLSEVSVLSHHGQEETKPRGQRDETLCFFCKRPCSSFFLAWLVEVCFLFSFFFFFFSSLLFGGVVFWILILGLVCCGGMKDVFRKQGFFAQVDVVLSDHHCHQVSVLSLWTGRDETSLTGG